MIALAMFALLALIAVYMLIDVVRCNVSAARYLEQDACRDDLASLPALSLYSLTQCAQGFAPCCDDFTDLIVARTIAIAYRFDAACGLYRRIRGGRFVKADHIRQVEADIRREAIKLAYDAPCDLSARDVVDTRYGLVLAALWSRLPYDKVHTFAEVMSTSDLTWDGLRQWCEDASYWAGLSSVPTTSAQTVRA